MLVRFAGVLRTILQIMRIIGQIVRILRDLIG